MTETGYLGFLSFFVYQAQTLSCMTQSHFSMLSISRRGDQEQQRGCHVTYQRVPGSSTQANAIIADTETTHAVLVAAQ